jgi:8-oxo-dGTP pyrophosphatase MutT (NUDIX family)
MSYSIYQIPPPDFTPQVAVAGCFCRWNDQVLFLKRHQNKPQGSTWGLPAGKLEIGESPKEAAIREVAEEVGFDIREGLEEVGKIYIQLENVGYIFYMFAKKFTTKPQIILEKEAHEEARWVTLNEALELPLILGGREVIELYKRWIQ